MLALELKWQGLFGDQSCKMWKLFWAPIFKEQYFFTEKVVLAIRSSHESTGYLNLKTKNHDIAREITEISLSEPRATLDPDILVNKSTRKGHDQKLALPI